MKRRIFGIETEYGITCAPLSGSEPPIDAQEAAEQLFAELLDSAHSTNVFLPNGARLYLDVGAHPEYATAECDQLSDLLANERAGDQIFAQMAASANEKLAAEGINGRIHLFKNNIDSAGHSFGCHENYLIRRQRDFMRRITSLIPFFVTRQILVGAGYINRGAAGQAEVSGVAGSGANNGSANGSGAPGTAGILAVVPARYEISSRAGQMWDAVSSASTRSRPMINTRDEPHGDPEKYRRMHVIVGDSNMSQSTIALKIGITNALLNVMEEAGAELPDFTLANPTQAIHEVARDLTGNAVVERADGRTITALELQRAIYAQVYDFYRQAGWLAQLSDLDRYVFDLWDRALTAFEQGAREKVATEIDWVAKERLFMAYQEHSGIALGDPRMVRLELAWHDITAGGLRAKLEASGALRTLVTPASVAAAKDTPPQTTRAKLRGEFIAAAQAQQRDIMVDWMNLRLMTEESSDNVLLRDPFSPSDPRVDELIAAVRQP